MQFKIGLRKSLLFLWTFVFLCFRPSIFGERYNSVVFVFLFLISLFTLFIFRKDISRVKSKPLGLLMLILVLVLYLFTQGVILSSAPRTVFNSCVLIAVTSLISFYILSLDKIFIIKSIVYIHVILSVSSIITFLMFVFGGFSSKGLISLSILNNFMDTSIPTDGHFFSYHHLFFPFSHSWANVGFLGIEIPRLLGIYREAGMAQLFFFTAYFLTYIVTVKRLKLVRAILFMGGMLTFSTAGLLSFIVGYIVLRFYPSYRIRISLKKILIILFVIPTIILAALFLPDIGLLNKISSISGNQRTQSYLYSLEKLAESPWFGHGYYKGFESMEDKNYIQFLGIIGVMYQIGVVGIILYFLPWIYSLSRLNNRNTYFILMPCLVTLLFSQPSYNDMIVWLLLLLNFKSLTINSEPGLTNTPHIWEH